MNLIERFYSLTNTANDEFKIEQTHDAKMGFMTWDEFVEDVIENHPELTEEEIRKIAFGIDSAALSTDPNDCMGTAGKEVTKEQKEESMDALCNVEEDTSGVTESFVQDFLEKYADGNDIIQTLRNDLMSLMSDVQWIKESGNQNEQFALDFADALNELSVSI